MRFETSRPIHRPSAVFDGNIAARARDEGAMSKILPSVAAEIPLFQTLRLEWDVKWVGLEFQGTEAPISM